MVGIGKWWNNYIESDQGDHLPDVRKVVNWDHFVDVNKMLGARGARPGRHYSIPALRFIKVSIAYWLL